MSKKKKNRKPALKLQPDSVSIKPDRALPLALWLILGLGLLIRALHLAFSRQSPFYEPLLLDPAYYHEWALKILGGVWVGDGVFYGLPLYPFFIALCYKFFGVSFLAVKSIQAGLGLVTLFFIYKTGEKLASERVGLVAALMAACYGPLFFHEGIFIPEALSLPLYAAGFYLACLFIERPTLRKGAVLGMVLALATLTKAGVLLFVLLLPLTWFLEHRQDKEKRFLPLLACLAAFFITLAPVTLHNFVYGKDRVLLTSHAGFNFYIGNNPDAEGVFAAPEGIGTNVEGQREDSKFVAEKELGRSLKPSEVSKYWADKAWDFIHENPGRFLELCFKKFMLFFDAREISDVEDYAFGKNFNPFLKLPWLGFGVIGPLFLLGVVAAFKTLRHRLLVVLWALTYLSGVITFFVNARYRLPLLGIIFPLAAVGLVELGRRFKERSWPRLLFYALVLCVGVGVTQARLVGTNWSKDHINVGDIYQKQKNYDQALLFYQKALTIDPDSYKANLAMGLVLTKLGRYDESKEYYLRSIEAHPDNPQALNNLGLWYDRQGNLEEARLNFLKALKLKPASSQIHNNLGMVYGKMGENEKAVEEFEISLKLTPNYARAYTNLGLILYRMGRVPEAKAMWEKALQIDPQFEEAKRALELLKSR